MKITINNVSINYEIHGDGPAVILAHGFGGNSTYWYQQIPVLSKYFKVIAYDQRGCGLSERPKSGYSILDFAEDLHALIDMLDITSTYLIGFSLGGAISLLTATMYPQLVKGLILSNSAVEFVNPVNADTRKKAKDLIETIKNESIVKRSEMFMSGIFSPGFRDKHPEIWNHYFQMLLQGNQQTLVKMIDAGINQAPPSPDLKKIRCPVLSIQGKYDPMVNEERRNNVIRLLPGTKMVTLESGHATAVELPDEFNQIAIKFLSQLIQSQR